MNSTSVVDAEIRKFGQLAGRWWDPDGPMKPLHRMNPARIGWIEALLPPGCRLLDAGCGAGLAAEALAMRGFDVLGIDASGEAIDAARAHAAQSAAERPDIKLAYRAATAEDLLAEGMRFPAVISLEVIEHVSDPAGFVQVLAGLLEPSGTLVLSTLNRTHRSWLTAKLGAEYVLRMLPVGTHDWRQFLTPPELARMLRQAGLLVTRTTGLVPDLLSGRWHTVRDTSVNYMIAAVK